MVWSAGEEQRRPKPTGTYLDTGSKVALQPDLLWSDGDRAMAVVDAKYKATKFANYPNADVYQMLAYCVRFGLETGHLVYAKGEEDPQIHKSLDTRHLSTVTLSTSTCTHPRSWIRYHV